MLKRGKKKKHQAEIIQPGVLFCPASAPQRTEAIVVILDYTR